MTVLHVRIYSSAGGFLINITLLVSAFYSVVASSRYRRALRFSQIVCIAISS